MATLGTRWHQWLFLAGRTGCCVSRHRRMVVRPRDAGGLMAKQQTFQEVLAAAIAEIVEHGYDSAERVERLMRELRMAAERSLISAASLEQQLRDGLAAV